MRVLGLDPGSRRTGFGVVERSGNRMICVVQGAVAPKPRLELPQRLHDIAARVGDVIEESRPDCVVVEKAFYHESVHSTLVLGHVRGALLVAAVQRGVAVAEYSPREIKLSVVGNGGATKDQVALMVRASSGLLHAAERCRGCPGDAISPPASRSFHRTARAASAAAERLAALAGARSVDDRLAAGPARREGGRARAWWKPGVGYRVNVSSHTARPA
jgi:crossover junction endodeoxyribonuclease RuvC